MQQLPSAPPSAISPYSLPYRRIKQTYDIKKKYKAPGNDFQSFLLKEKEFQLNIMNNLNDSTSLHGSFRKSQNLGGSYMSDFKSPGYMFQNDKKPYRGGDSFNSESSGSLKYMSKNLNA